MNFVFVFFLFWSIIFMCDCQSSIDKSSEETGVKTRVTEACDSISEHCRTVILSEGDYLFLSEDELFIKPLSMTIDSSSYVKTNDTVIVCECLFYGQETSESRRKPCNLTFDDCLKVTLKSEDILHLSDATIFIKSLNTRLNDSEFGVVGGNVVACECLNSDQKADVFPSHSCHFINGVNTMSNNCSTVTLKPEDYHILSNATLRIFAWNVTLNNSFYSVKNGSMTVCAPDYNKDVWSRILVMFFFSIIAFFTFFVFSGNCTPSRMGLAKVSISFLKVASDLFTLEDFTSITKESGEILVLMFSHTSIMVVIGFGMLTILSSDLMINVTQRTRVVEMCSTGFCVIFYMYAKLMILNTTE